MKAQIMLKSIGWGRVHKIGWQAVDAASRRPWVAEITPPSGRALYGLRYLRAGGADYRQSNGSGTRGVRRVYILETGRTYLVQECVNWRKTRQFFCRVTDAGAVEELDYEETMSWIRQEYGKNLSE